jgi:hypothetical protein
VAASIDELLAEMKENPRGVRFSDACKVADNFFGAPTQNASSHRVWKMPWPGNPSVARGGGETLEPTENRGGTTGGNGRRP